MNLVGQLSIAAILLVSLSAQAIELTRLFTAGAGQNGELAEPSSHFELSEKVVHVRFAYRDGIPGQALKARWLIEAGDGSQSAFGESEVTLNKAEDIGQFSFRPDGDWVPAHYRVLIEDPSGNVVDSIRFRVGDVSAFDVGFAQDTSLRIDQVSVAGADRRGKPAKAQSRFRTTDKLIGVRFRYRDARPGDSVIVRWEQVGGDRKGRPGIGAFAQTSLLLDPGQDKAFSTFAPQGGPWLPGKYRVTLLDQGQELAVAKFEVRKPRVAKSTKKKAAPKKLVRKTAGRKPTPAPASTPPRVLETVLAKSIENARPKDPVSSYSDVWRRLFLWTRIEGGSAGGKVRASWYSGEGQGRLLARNEETVTPGENWVVFWLYFKPEEGALPVGPARVVLSHKGKTLKTINFSITRAGLFDGLSDAFEQMGNEIDWLMDQQLKE